MPRIGVYCNILRLLDSLIVPQMYNRPENVLRLIICGSYVGIAWYEKSFDRLRHPQAIPKCVVRVTTSHDIPCHCTYHVMIRAKFVENMSTWSYVEFEPPREKVSIT